MDRSSEKHKRFDWLPTEMPGVARLVRERREKDGDAHVAECWRRGVIEREPGWFFAREGSIAIGTPWDEPVMANFAALQVSSTQALLVMRGPSVAVSP